MRDPYPIHGRRWSIWHPFGFSCRCGLNAYPCLVEETWNRNRPEPPPQPPRMFRGDFANDRPTGLDSYDEADRDGGGYPTFPWDGEIPVRPWRRARW